MNIKTKKEKQLKDFKVETFDGVGYFNFFTLAENHKKALRNLETNSADWKRIVKKDSDLTIKVVELK